MKTFLITYNSFRETIDGQHIWQIGTTKLECWNISITDWDLFPKISMCLRPQLEKNGQKTRLIQRRIPLNHHSLFIMKTRTHWWQWWELALRTMPPMLESWCDSDKETPKNVVESWMGMHNEITFNLQGSPPYYIRKGW